MPANNPAQAKVVCDALRRFPTTPKQSLARFLIARNPELFENQQGKVDLQVARHAIRYYTGAMGTSNRNHIPKDKQIPHGPTEQPRSRSEAKSPYTLPPGLWLILADTHNPWHDVEAIEAAVAYGQKQKVNGVLLNGDIQDAAGVGLWPRTEKPDFLMEVEQVLDWIDWLRSEFPHAKIVWKPANHEDRLEMLYRSLAPQLADLPTANTETVLGLEKRGILYLQRKQLIRAGKLSILHGHELRGGSLVVNAARWLRLKWQACALCAHWHRSSQDDSTSGENEMISTWSMGCLCNLHPDYNPLANQWTHGFGILNLDKNGQFEFENKRILHNGKVV